MRLQRRYFLLWVVILLIGPFGLQRPADAAFDYECEDICYLDSDCNQYCIYTPPPPYEGIETTCGEQFSECGDTCDTTCSFQDGGGTECAGNGGDEMTCGEYPRFLTCGDGICEDGEEDCGGCATDCGECPEIDISEIDDLEALHDEMQGEGGLEGTMAGGEVAAEVGYAMGWQQGPPPQRNVLGDFTEGDPCEFKRLIIDVDNQMIGILQSHIRIINFALDYLYWGMTGNQVIKAQNARNQIQSAINTYIADRDSIVNMRCGWEPV